MLSERMQQKLNEQIQKEFFSAYLYLSMDAYLTSLNLTGFAHFFRVQAMEERDHAMMFFSYVNHVNGRVALTKIDAPKVEFESLEDVFNTTLTHEITVTESIYSIMDLAIEEKDHKTNSFLQWFVNEQAEEEATADSNLKKLKLVGNDGRGILMLDAELAQRVYVPPVNPALPQAGQ